MSEGFRTISSVDELKRLYGQPVQAALDKVATRITPCYRAWISESRFVVLGTVGPEGTDASPRGDSGPVVDIVDDKTLMLPDWMGNNRIDSLSNIVRDGRACLMFMVPGASNVVRVNGQAAISDDPTLCDRYIRGSKLPRSVIIFSVAQVYFQCAKAIIRAELWGGAPHPKVPSAGDFIAEFRAGFDAQAYDHGYADYAAPRLW